MFPLRIYIFLLSFCQFIEAGHYMVWLPLSSKSVKIGVMEVGYELARRGHQVTLISPHNSKKQVQRVTEIVIESVFEELQDKVTEDMLVNNGADNVGLPINAFIDTSINDNESALNHPDVKNIIDNDNVKVDDTDNHQKDQNTG